MKTTEAKLYINGVVTSAHPIYSDKIAVTTTRQEGEMYRRTNLNSEFQFLNDDYDLINDKSLDSLFEIRLFDKGTNTLLARGVFTKMDCDFDTDNKICKVKTTSSDDYDKILGGMNTEYDLISLLPQRHSLLLHKQPIVQIYVMHDTKVTNIIGGQSYEVDVASGIDVDRITINELENVYNFEKIKDPTTTIAITNMPINVIQLIGEYKGVYSPIGFVGLTFTKTTNNYKLVGRKTGPHYYYIVTDMDGIEITYQNRWITTQPSIEPYNPLYGVVLGSGQAQQGGLNFVPVDTMKAGVWEDGIFARILLDMTPQSPLGDLLSIDVEDFVSYNMNYKMSMTSGGIIQSSWIRFSDVVQDDPTEWGVNGDGKYFVKPSPLVAGGNVIPIGWSRWIPKSIWFEADSTFFDMLRLSYMEDWVMRDGIPLYNAIELLLEQIDPTIHFLNGAQYSQFLYGTIDSSVLPMWQPQWLYMTPISNIKKTYYDQAARKGTITLGNILDMLRNTMQLYWFIERTEVGGMVTKKLRIEHITWFKNGGNYVQQDPLIDLTQCVTPMSKKDWSFGQNTFSYDKSSLIKRYEFGWATDCLEMFNGFPIDINNNYVSGGRVNSAKVGKFVADIDMLVSAPTSFNDDDWALMSVDRTSVKNCNVANLYTFYHGVFVAPNVTIQNPYLSFFYLEDAFWLYNMSGDDATTSKYRRNNGQVGLIAIEGKGRFKTTTLKFPLRADLVGKEGLIAYRLGVGEWVKSSYTGEDGMVEMDIVMNIEEPLITYGTLTRKSGGNMTMSVNEGTTSMSIVLDGGKMSAMDYAYVRIIANKGVRVTMTPSSEANFDIGWANSSPITDYVTAKTAQYHASGTTPTSFTLNKGNSIYIGYAKDGNGFANNDKITFNIVAI